MAQGIRVWDALNRLIFTSENPIGGVYVGVYPQSAGAATWVFDGSSSFPNIGALRLRAIQYQAGCHQWQVVNNNTITFVPRQLSGNTFRLLNQTTLIVFAI